MTYSMLLSADEATPSNPTWHKMRREGVSASEIAAVLGISPWESPFSLYHQKVNGWEAGDNDEMRAGRYAEPAVAAWYADRDGDFVLRSAGLYASTERPWQLATPDRLICQDRLCGSCDAGLPMSCTCDEDVTGLLECKYVIGGWHGWGEPGTDDVPVYYRAQCLWQLDVLGVDEVHLAAWHDADFRLYIIRRDEMDLRVMREAGERFMHRIAEGDAPDVDEHNSTIRALKALHPLVDDVSIDVPVEFAEGYRRARALKAKATALVDRYEARARQTLGTGRRLMCNGRLVVSRSVYDQTGDAAELLALDGEPAYVDRLNAGRTASYLTPKGTK